MRHFLTTLPRLALAGMSLLLCTASHGAVAPGKARPNVVFLLADDMGWGDLGCQGAKTIRTPHIDQLAAQGVRFTQFYSNGPECSPTRTAFLTGRYQQRVGGLECAIGTGNVGRYDDAIRLADNHDLGLPADEPTIVRLLKDAGYGTALIGKWHLGYEDKFAPMLHGFDYALYCQGGGMDYFHHVEDPPAYSMVLRLNGKPLDRRQYFTEMIADDATRWLAQPERRQSPFFLYVPFTAPHSPYQGPDDDQPEPLPADSDRWKQGKGAPGVYAAMIESLDAAVGRILKALEDMGAAENTLVIFQSDNGGTRNALPCGLRDFKGSTFEGGIRVPCIARWPGVLTAGTEYPHPAVTFDFTASIARACGVEMPAARPFDGVDILKYAQAGEAPPTRNLYWRIRRGDRTAWAAREGSLKYVAETKGGETEEFLFDLANDLSEKTDLLPSRGQDAERLRGALKEWETRVKPRR